MRIINHTDASLKLGEEIISKIRMLIKQKGRATVLLSGGNTPKKLYQYLDRNLKNRELVTFGLVDERFVSLDHSKSNEKMIKDAFQNSIKLIGMVQQSDNYEQNLKLVNEQYQRNFSEIDICILGMGKDGHYASIFPNDKNSTLAEVDQSPKLHNTSAPVSPENRITCNSVLLKKSNYKYLLILDKNKLDIVQSNEQILPIQRFLKNNPKTVVFYGRN